MSRFSSLLKSINERLDAPPPIKARILLEISADLDDAYDFYRQSGASDEEATRLAQEKFILDDSTIAELSSIHQPLLQKWMDKMAVNVQSRWERIVLVLTLITIAILSGRIVLTNQMFQQSIFVWPIWGLTLAGLLQFFCKFYKLYLVKDYKIKILRKGINVIGYMGAFCLALGFTGYFYELLRHGVDTVYPGGSLITLVTTVPTSEQHVGSIAECFMVSSSVMMASLLSTMFLALFWYTLHIKTSAVEMAEAELLLT